MIAQDQYSLRVSNADASDSATVRCPGNGQDTRGCNKFRCTEMETLSGCSTGLGYQHSAPLWANARGANTVAEGASSHGVVDLMLARRRHGEGCGAWRRNRDRSECSRSRWVLSRVIFAMVIGCSKPAPQLMNWISYRPGHSMARSRSVWKLSRRAAWTRGNFLNSGALRSTTTA